MNHLPSLFYGTAGPKNAHIMIVGECWGHEEEKRGCSGEGEASQELGRMLQQAGINVNTTFRTNVFNVRPLSGQTFSLFHPTAETKGRTPYRGLYPTEEALHHINLLHQTVREIKPTLIIALGNYALWALTSHAVISQQSEPRFRWSGKVPVGITDRRGSQYWTDETILPRIPVLPTIHPSSILKQWVMRPYVVHDFQHKIPKALKGEWEAPAYDLLSPPSFKTAQEYLTTFLNHLTTTNRSIPVAVDIETSTGCLISCSLCYEPRRAIAFPFIKADRSSYWPFEEECTLVDLLRQVLLHPAAEIVGQNFLYDMQYLSKWWRVETPPAFDTLLAQHVLFPGTPKGLHNLASLYCDYFYFWKDDSKEWAADGDVKKLLDYNCLDTIHTFEIYQTLQEALTAEGLLNVYEMKLSELRFAFEMMERGILIDKNQRATMSMEIVKSVQPRRLFLQSIVPDFALPPTTSKTSWWSSPKQLATLLYTNMGLKTIHHKKTAAITTNDEALNLLKLRYPELTQIFDTILDLRSLGVFQNTFLAAAIDPDGHMRCSFNPAGTYTMRWSSSKNAFGRGANLQNIPKGGER